MKWYQTVTELKTKKIFQGLGKTVQIIAFLAWAKQNSIKGPHLIIVPSSTFENWMIELDKWAPELSYTPYYGLSLNPDLKNMAGS